MVHPGPCPGQVEEGAWGLPCEGWGPSAELMVVVNLYRALGGGWELGLDWLPKKEEGETEGDSSSEGGSSSAASPAEGSGADQPSEPAAPDPGKKTEAGSTP